MSPDLASDAAYHRVRAGGADFLHPRGARPTSLARLAFVDPFACGFEGGFGVAGLALRGVPGAVGGGGVALGRFGVFLRSCQRLTRFSEPFLGLGRIARSPGTFELCTARPMLGIADRAFRRFTLALGFQVRSSVRGSLELWVFRSLGPWAPCSFRPAGPSSGSRRQASRNRRERGRGRDGRASRQWAAREAC